MKSSTRVIHIASAGYAIGILCAITNCHWLVPAIIGGVVGWYSSDITKWVGRGTN